MVSERGGSWYPSELSVVAQRELMSSLGSQSHLSRRALFCKVMFMIPKPPNRLGSTTRFHGTRQWTLEKVSVAPLHKKWRFILVRVLVTHVGRRNACM
jgi:hypothetical protein